MNQLEIRNYTDWRGDDLRRLFMAGLRDAGATAWRDIRVRYHKIHLASESLWQTRGRGKYGVWSVNSEGAHYIQGRGISMWLPHPDFIATIIDGEQLAMKVVAQVFEHEVMHTLGMRHREMAQDIRWCSQPVPWSEGLRLRPKVSRSRAAAGSTKP